MNKTKSCSHSLPQGYALWNAYRSVTYNMN